MINDFAQSVVSGVLLRMTLLVLFSSAWILLVAGGIHLYNLHRAAQFDREDPPRPPTPAGPG